MGTRNLAAKLYRVCRGSVSAPVNVRLGSSHLSIEAPYFLHRKYIPWCILQHKPSLACNYFSSRYFYTRHVSQLVPSEVRKVIFIDTHALVQKLEAQGFTTKQAEAITSAITDVLNSCLENVAQSFVSISELQKSEMLRENALSKLRNDVQAAQDKRMMAIHRDMEKLRADIEKLRSEMRFEMDKVSANQRLDLNLERGRMTEELAKQSAETSKLTNRLNNEIHALKAILEASKYEVIKYCIGTIVSVIALGLALLRVFK
ncbi:hypothetical protein KP509_17G032700 [Ceratopteris richardii]|uniref:Uncharacterized protein n=1 Tax=Ceratopteris richardii TaxID=49495 RepID=A0A8T2STA6_CERRI|nr:hypothetical protein KP509_17G032700 [Ceratopteris richardii]KAH7373003.1 hypothetical protein KP509_17G032700 [Ceratopteris richardii]KAH7373004.1 hypothetical protein KP509_17G032700 [Ceratopteris richardii]